MGRKRKVKQERKAERRAAVQAQIGEVETRCGHYEEARNYRCLEKAIWEMELFDDNVVRACDDHAEALKKRKQVRRRRLISLMSSKSAIYPLTS